MSLISSIKSKKKVVKLNKIIPKRGNNDKQKRNNITLEIDDVNYPKNNTLINAGKQLLDSEKYITLDNQNYSFPVAYSIINPTHKGIKKMGHELYDPYLIQVCKSAIFREKKNLPNYKEIIQRVDTEFGIKGVKKSQIDTYYKNLIEKSDKDLENYIKSLKDEKKEEKKEEKKKKEEEEK